MAHDNRTFIMVELEGDSESVDIEETNGEWTVKAAGYHNIEFRWWRRIDLSSLFKNPED